MKRIKLLAFILAITSLPIKAETRVPVITDEDCFSNNLIISWKSLIKELKEQDIYTQLREVNYFFNRNIIHEDDVENWGKEDYWATPFETMFQGAGDCEDYSTAKYKTLLLLDIPESHLKLHYVNARVGRSDKTIPHMVLSYTDDNYNQVVLDNLVPSITPLEQRVDLETIFAFNSNELWIDDIEYGNPQGRISKWREFLHRYEIQKNSCLTL